MSRNTHDRAADHHGTETSDYVVIAGPIGPYLAGTTLTQVLGATVSGGTLYTAASGEYADSGVRFVNPERYLGAARRSVVSGWDAYMTVDAPNSGGFWRMTAYDTPATHSARITGSGASGWVAIESTEQVRVVATGGLVLPVLAADPPAVNGGAYYNTVAHKVKFCENGVWKTVTTS